MKKNQPVLFSDDLFNAAIKDISLPELKPESDYFNYLIRSVVYQQLSGKAAATIYGRFTGLFPKGKPEAKKIQALELEVLRSVGLSGQKSRYIKNIAEFSLEHDFSDTFLNNLSDEDVIRYLTQIKGVGQWTVEMLLIFAMQRKDLFPLDDLGIQSGIIKMYNLDPSLSKKELKQRMLEIAENWKPNRSLATRYIWAWKDGK